MGRSPRASSFWVVPGCTTQERKQRAVKFATGRVVGPVKLELEGVVKSTWNFHNWTTYLAKVAKKAGSPAAGWMVPSISEGSMVA